MLDIAMAALVALVKTNLGFDLVDKVAEWFLDGAPEAMAILPSNFQASQGTCACSMQRQNKAAGSQLDSSIGLFAVSK